MEQHEHCSPMAGGPQLPDKGLFQYPANMDGGGVHAIRYLKPRGPMGYRHGPTRLRSQVAAIGGGTASMARTLAHTSTSPLLLHHTTKLFSCNIV